MAADQLLAAPCGLYCGVCIAFDSGECHGCGCTCGSCAGQAHYDQCAIAACARARALESCAECPELPCTRLIQFTCDPIWRTHAPCIENLRRRALVGTEAWLDEQREYWSEEAHRAGWSALFEECLRRKREAGA